MVGRPAFLRIPTGEAARSIGRHFSVSRGRTGGLTRVVGCALFWRISYRAGGCHQAREGNTDRSTHWHCILLAGHPFAARKEARCPMPITLDGVRECKSVAPWI